MELKQNISTTEDARRLENIQLDILNSSSIFLLQQNINLQKQVNILNTSLTLMQQNMTTSEDMRRLENILKFEVKQTVSDREQEMMKNISAMVTDLELRDRYLSLSLLDVHSNMTMFNHTLSKLKQQQKTDKEQQNMTIEQLTHSLQNNTVKLSNILSSLQTRVAFTAGVHYDDKHNFAPSETIIFPRVMYEVGGGYNPRTGVFTAPKAGLYLIFSTVVGKDHEIIRTQIRINGSLKASIMAYVTSSTAPVYQSASNLVVQQLQVGDRVWIRVYQGTNFYSDYEETTFSVAMINESLI
ncbi:uncharacterized protein LOC134272096 [Saccostrea cucullata]|uniref:uncharacterized protein LOC134272096 n=1 Tax=Saccostrea cuccullata TaxID=36930 RepID=UPI002ED19EFD